MEKKDKTVERFLLSLLAVHIKDVLDLDNSVSISIEDYGFETDHIKRRVIIDFPSIESCGKFIGIWASWKNAYKYRKR
jgi:hypothetical protein